jgi:hypothetical protein
VTDGKHNYVGITSFFDYHGRPWIAYDGTVPDKVT